MRANTFVAENQGLNVLETNVNVIGGHAGTTILPLLSQVPGTKFSDEDISALTNRIQFMATKLSLRTERIGNPLHGLRWATLHFSFARSDERR